MRIMPASGRVLRVPVCTIGMVSAVVLSAARASAEALPSAELTVSRTPEAASCADEITLARELRSRMSPTAAREPGPLHLFVALSTEGDSFVATVRVEGRKQGIRTLASKGPTCEGLHDALVVSLLLLLDERPSLPEASPPAPSSPPLEAPAPEAPSTVVAPAPTPLVPPPTFWISVGGALTHGLPEGWGGAGTADLSIRIRSFDISLGGLLAPLRAHPLSAGRRVDVGLIGGRARGCYAFLDHGVRASACAVAMVSRLSGRGTGAADVTEEPATSGWWLFGAGPDVLIPLSSRIGVGISAALLVQARAVSFYIRPNSDEAYTTDSVVGSIGADVRLRIW